MNILCSKNIFYESYTVRHQIDMSKILLLNDVPLAWIPFINFHDHLLHRIEGKNWHKDLFIGHHHKMKVSVRSECQTQLKSKSTDQTLSSQSQYL